MNSAGKTLNILRRSIMKSYTSLQTYTLFGANLPVAGLMLLLASVACNLPGGPATLPQDGTQPTDTIMAGTALPTTEMTATLEMPAAPGTQRGKPAARTETVATRNWEFSVVEVLRGDEALKKLEEASQANGPPEDKEMEYVLVRVHVRYIGTDTEKQNIDRTFFQSIGSADVVYKRPSILDVKTPKPVLQADLLPGEESEGWVTVVAAKADPAPVLLIQPRVNGLLSAAEEWRYISLE
jgi:hypothetical protein